MILYLAGKIRDASLYRRMKNIEHARDVAVEIYKKGYIALTPHLYTLYMAGEVPENILMEADYKVIDKCDGVFMLDNWKDSEGAKAEHAYATSHNKPIYYSLDEL